MNTIREFWMMATQLRWTVAKTMPEVPHEYIVRHQVTKEIFDWMVTTIREAGFTAYWKGKEGLYLIAGNHYYWTMGDVLEKTIIINRAVLKDYSLINLEWSYTGSEIEDLH